MVCIITARSGKAPKPGFDSWPDGPFVDQLLWPLATPGTGWLSPSNWPSVMELHFSARSWLSEEYGSGGGKQWCWLLGTWGRVRAPILHSLTAVPPRHVGCHPGTMDFMKMWLPFPGFSWNHLSIQKIYSYFSSLDQMHRRIWCELVGWRSSNLLAY